MTIDGDMTITYTFFLKETMLIHAFGVMEVLGGEIRVFDEIIPGFRDFTGSLERMFGNTSEVWIIKKTSKVVKGNEKWNEKVQTRKLLAFFSSKIS
ncbi:hypothetical protein ACFX2I_023257 [Malus domestica]